MDKDENSWKMAENHRKLLKHLTTAKHCENSWTLLKSADNGSKLLKTIDYAKATIQKETGQRKKIFKKKCHAMAQHTTTHDRHTSQLGDWIGRFSENCYSVHCNTKPYFFYNNPNLSIGFFLITQIELAAVDWVVV